MTDCRNEFPAELVCARQAFSVAARPDAQLFRRRTLASPCRYGGDKGWIYPDDPRGWFQWYCCYHPWGGA